MHWSIPFAGRGMGTLIEVDDEKDISMRLVGFNDVFNKDGKRNSVNNRCNEVPIISMYKKHESKKVCFRILGSK